MNILKQKLSNVKVLGRVAFNDLLDIRDELKAEYKTLLEAFHVEDHLDIQDEEARKLGARIEDLLDVLMKKAESLSDWLDQLEEVDLIGF